MKNLRQDLIKLGSENPDLQAHIAPIIEKIDKTASLTDLERALYRLDGQRIQLDSKVYGKLKVVSQSDSRIVIKINLKGQPGIAKAVRRDVLLDLEEATIELRPFGQGWRMETYLTHKGSSTDLMAHTQLRKLTEKSIKQMIQKTYLDIKETEWARLEMTRRPVQKIPSGLDKELKERLLDAKQELDEALAKFGHKTTYKIEVDDQGDAIFAYFTPRNPWYPTDDEYNAIIDELDDSWDLDEGDSVSFTATLYAMYDPY